MIKEDGGPAFPSEIYGEFDIQYWNGMSLRDYFAGQALAGLCANPRPVRIEGIRSISAQAYLLADAMLVERPK